MSDDPTEFLLRFQQLTQRTHDAAAQSATEAKRLNHDSQKLVMEARRMIEQMTAKVQALQPPPAPPPPHWVTARQWWLILVSAVPLSIAAGTIIAARAAAGSTNLTTFEVWWRIFVG